MKITSVETFIGSVPLHTPFKTALRTVTVAESIIVKITSEDGYVGWGEAPPTHVITGESLASIEYAIHHVIKPFLIGNSLSTYERIFEQLQACMIGNTSAKAAVDMAIYDLLAQYAKLPLYQYLGGYHSEIETDYTVSVNTVEEMVRDANQYKLNGFSILKVKVGKDQIETDMERIKAIRQSVGNEVRIRLDANQGWNPKEAVKVIQKMEDLQLNIELVEQPVIAKDLEGLKFVTDRTETPIMADEAVFSIHDARQVLENKAADLINIKLMKSGGIHQARKIATLAQSYGIECMVGSMIETKLGISAAAHFAASHPVVTRFDFDAPLMLSGDLVHGGVIYKGSHLSFSEDYGLGICGIRSEFLRQNTMK
ncbi:muconate cycloisomerase [Oceanobacillus iheyensis HTE831]|uniref:Dipeptide epimerase n=1 Tax=Oceanobacillus iheyensis (strain DSM 14371 / CIP 107618 / JCM 11309 / KCTC 3954 / HTE831) TaxID=221109 RepID=Q8EM93_OCEIH|nr:dipeptide epimerase [Oceanobacillus iheyensis]BAC14921.1 muconate cycloisomerase [Oceanobacillus iheyensis HTE831]